MGSDDMAMTWLTMDWSNTYHFETAAREREDRLRKGFGMGGGTQSTRESKGLGNGQEQSKNWVFVLNCCFGSVAKHNSSLLISRKENDHHAQCFVHISNGSDLPKLAPQLHQSFHLPR